MDSTAHRLPGSDHSPDPGLELAVEVDDSGPGHRRVLRLRGELDLATAGGAVEAITRAAAGRSRLWLDLGGLDFCDVVGATALELAVSRLRERGCRLTLLGVERGLGPMSALDGLFPRLREAAALDGPLQDRLSAAVSCLPIGNADDRE
jgi:anti-anti-sigma factor